MNFKTLLYSVLPYFLQNVRNYSPNGRAAHPRIPESSAFFFFWQNTLHLECVPRSDFNQNFILILLTFGTSNLIEMYFGTTDT